MIGRTVSHYRILSKLGEGGMGTVYVAEDTLLRRRVAIKSLKLASVPGQTHFRTRFLREARAASLLNHYLKASNLFEHAIVRERFPSESYADNFADFAKFTRTIVERGVRRDKRKQMMGASTNALSFRYGPR